YLGRLPYPKADLDEAGRALAFGQFHDILPGSSIPPAEEAALRLFDFGLEKTSRIKARAFLALAAGQPAAGPDEIPLFVFNPHPFEVERLVEVEFQPAEPNYEGGFLLPSLRDGRGRPVVSQPEKEHCTLSLEWRKRAVFRAALAPFALSRFDCRLDRRAEKPEPGIEPGEDGLYRLGNEELEVLIDARTGLLNRLRCDGRDYLLRGAFEPLVIRDNGDPWGMTVRSFRKRAGAFRPASPRGNASLAGAERGPSMPVRVIEDGPVRTVVEAVLSHRSSFLVHRYKVPKHGTEVEVETRVLWNEKDKMLKLRLPTPFGEGPCLGQAAYGVEEMFGNGDETVSQKWLAVLDGRRSVALTVVKDRIYGADYKRGELRLSLLRSPAYAADPSSGRPLVSQDRFLPRQDQGEHVFRFWLKPGEAASRLAAVDREALVHSEQPYTLSFFPRGSGRAAGPFLELEDDCVQMTAVKRAEDGNDLVLRLFNPTGEARRTALRLLFVRPDDPVRHELEFGPFEVRTLRIDPETGRATETDLLERPLGGGKA
ncbi:MAG: alpha-mannosidase, partial [Candidatus Aminicenantes bacterium]|nr:alpha-mannosidase [Candidatus Aminicenantes bacterium]